MTDPKDFLGDRLSTMLNNQAKFSLDIRDMVRRKQHPGVVIADNLPEERVKWTKEYALATNMEVTEVVDMLKWKPHREEHHYTTLDVDGIGEELIDVMNYTLAQLGMWGFTSSDVFQLWQDKFNVLNQRQYQEKTHPLRKDEPIVMVDLDGCIADFRSGLVKYLKDIGLIPEDAVDPCMSYHIDKDFNLDPLRYRQAKWDFEAAGGYRTLPLMPGAVDIIDAADHMGRIVFITSRTVPLKRIYRDTLIWIQSHFPALRFVLYVDDRKAERLALHNCKVLACVEDDPSHAQRLLQSGFRVVMPSHGYNTEWRSANINNHKVRWAPNEQVGEYLKLLDLELM